MSHKEIAISFVARSFRAPFLQDNQHYQTIIGSDALRVKIFGPYPRNFPTVKERLYTPDNDFFDVQYTCPVENFTTNQGIVVLVHGMESSPMSPLITKMACAYLERGFSCVLYSFRGCSGEPSWQPGCYHIGFTRDLLQLIKLLHERYPTQKIFLSGFSLGGNVSLKLLGELGDSAHDLGLCGAAVTCVPFDIIYGQQIIDSGINRAVYAENFLKTLKARAEREFKKFPEAYDIEPIRKATTLGEFDEHYIAKVFGFKDKEDYYRQSESKWWLPHIRVPTIAINAIDDPLFAGMTLPTEDDVGDAPVRCIYHDNGGHCGWIATDDSFMIPGVHDESNPPVVPSYGWIADELARAIWHIHTKGDPELADHKRSQPRQDFLTKPQVATIMSVAPLIFAAVEFELSWIGKLWAKLNK